MLPNKGEGETVVFETRLGVLKTVGDSDEESDVNGEADGLLSLNNNPLLLLYRPNFAPSALGTGRCSVWSFTTVTLVSMGTPNSRRGRSAPTWTCSGSPGGGIIGVVIAGIGGHGGEQGYDGFLSKLEHCVFGEDVILTEDSGKIEKLLGGEGVVCADRFFANVIRWLLVRLLAVVPLMWL